MQFMIRENEIKGAEEKLRYQAGQQREFQTEMQTCLLELKKLAPLETECALLLSVMKRMQGETFQQEQMADVLSTVMDLYRKCENQAVESAYGSEARRIGWDVGRIEVPVYPVGVIKKR